MLVISFFFFHIQKSLQARACGEEEAGQPEFKASWIYRVSSRAAKVTQVSPVSKNKQKSHYKWDFLAYMEQIQPTEIRILSSGRKAVESYCRLLIQEEKRWGALKELTLTTPSERCLLSTKRDNKVAGGCLWSLHRGPKPQVTISQGALLF